MDTNPLALQAIGYVLLAITVVLVIWWEWLQSEEDRQRRKAEARKRDAERLDNVRRIDRVRW